MNLSNKNELIDYLDNMLKWFYNRPHLGTTYIQFRNEYSTIQMEHNVKIRNGALNQLIKDGYLQELEAFVTDNTGSQNEVVKKEEGYIISYKGIMFLAEGGYREMFLREELANNRLKNLETHQLAHQSYMTVLTIVISLFGLIQSVYYFLDLHLRKALIFSSFHLYILMAIAAIEIIVLIGLLLKTSFQKNIQ